MATKLQETSNSYGGNMAPMMEEIKKARDEVNALMAKRDDINAKIGEIRASIKALGIPKKAFDDAVKRFNMDPEKRAELDDSFAIACEAMGVPLKEQGELFTVTAKGENEDAKESNEQSITEQQVEAIQSAANG